MHRVNKIKSDLKKMTKHFVFLIAVGLHATTAGSVDLFVHEGVKLEAQEAGDTIKLRKLAVPNQGFKSGQFKWDSAKSAWVLSGALVTDGYLERLGLTKLEDGSMIFETRGIGKGFQGVTIKTPKGAVFNLAHGETEQGLESYGYDSGMLPANQQTFEDGKYVMTYTLSTGGTVTRTCYLSGSYPTSVNITSPTASATGIALAPTIMWTAVGASSYDLYIADVQTGDEVYYVTLLNAYDTSLSHTVPSGVLQPGRTYRVELDANSPNVNCGNKGISRQIQFTTRN